jgi:ATP-dependent Clp protease protease subunit
MRLQELLRDVLSKHTGQPIEKITHDSDRDFYLTPQQAVEYGIIDEILKTSKKDKEKKK